MDDGLKETGFPAVRLRGVKAAHREGCEIDGRQSGASYAKGRACVNSLFISPDASQIRADSIPPAVSLVLATEARGGIFHIQRT